MEDESRELIPFHLIEIVVCEDIDNKAAEFIWIEGFG
jgi:hypothetical protein